MILQGHVIETLKQVEEGSIQTCITSPPYYNLRKYEVEPVVWGGDSSCDHKWGDEIPGNSRGGSGTPTNKSNRGEGYGRAAPRGKFCACGAWLGQLGLEPTLDLFVSHNVEVFSAVRRVLADDGTLWVNFGDSYCTSPRGNKPGSFSTSSLTNPKRQDLVSRNLKKSKPAGLKNKDLMMVPFRIAMALQQDGWYLRSVIPWVKSAAMPESVQDRPPNSCEYWFLLTKSKRCYYNIDAIRKKHTTIPQRRLTDYSEHQKGSQSSVPISSYGDKLKKEPGVPGNEKGRARRTSDWWFDSIRQIRDDCQAILDKKTGPVVGDEEILSLYCNPKGFSGAHFAVFPRSLIRPMILSCSRPGDTVLDTFGGSGTVAIECEELDREWIICELSKKYVELANNRIEKSRRIGMGFSKKEAESSQRRLF